jgi:hypothetical protein
MLSQSAILFPPRYSLPRGVPMPAERFKKADRVNVCNHCKASSGDTVESVSSDNACDDESDDSNFMSCTNDEYTPGKPTVENDQAEDDLRVDMQDAKDITYRHQSLVESALAWTAHAERQQALGVIRDMLEITEQYLAVLSGETSVVDVDGIQTYAELRRLGNDIRKKGHGEKQIKRKLL